MPSVSSMTIEIDQSSGVARVAFFLLLSLVCVYSYACLSYDSFDLCHQGMFSFLPRVDAKCTILVLHDPLSLCYLGMVSCLSCVHVQLTV